MIRIVLQLPNRECPSLICIPRQSPINGSSHNDVTEPSKQNPSATEPREPPAHAQVTSRTPCPRPSPRRSLPRDRSQQLGGMDASPAYSRAPKPSSPIGGLLEFAANLSPLAGERKHSSGPTPAELRRQDHHVPNLCSPHSRPKDHEDERLRKCRIQFHLAVSSLLRLEPR